MNEQEKLYKKQLEELLKENDAYNKQTANQKET